MDENVILSIKSSQTPSDGQGEIRLTTGGSLVREGEELVLSYRESALTGLEGTLTVLRVGPEGVILTRTGALNSQIVFRQGQRHFSQYRTPYGSISLSVYTHSLCACLDEGGGSVELDYSLELEHRVESRHSFHITVRRRGPSAGG